MITFRQVDKASFSQYDTIDMLVHVSSYYRIDKINHGLGGFLFEETPCIPFVKDFDANLPLRNFASAQAAQFDTTFWGFFMAFDDAKAVGGAMVAARTKDVHMLSGRNELAVLWDIRVSDAYKHRGIGQTLFDMAVDWARREGFAQLKIECQNNNVPAVKFYHKQGAVLAGVDEYAYFNEPAYRHEVQLLWMLDL